jgi:hypothetical protein
MALTRYELHGSDTGSIQAACEVCNERSVTTLVANFIFACDRCARRISMSLWLRREERARMEESFYSGRQTRQWVH